MFGKGTADRYGMISIAKPDGRYIPQNAHRISWEIHFGPIPDGLWVLHHCDVRGCVNPNHLFLGRPIDNTRDMISKGRKRVGRQATHRRMPRGIERAHNKLSEANVVDARQRWMRGESMRSIGRDYGVTHETVRRVVRCETWTHI